MLGRRHVPVAATTFVLLLVVGALSPPAASKSPEPTVCYGSPSGKHPFRGPVQLGLGDAMFCEGGLLEHSVAPDHVGCNAQTQSSPSFCSTIGEVLGPLGPTACQHAGPACEAAPLRVSGLCGVQSKCFEFPFEVVEEAPGSLLRFAVHLQLPSPDTVRREDGASAANRELLIELFAPGADPATDKPVAAGSTDSIPAGAYSVERNFTQRDASGADVGISAGRWILRIVPYHVVQMTFQVRVKLEPRDSARDVLGAAYPDLRPIPPFEMSFSPHLVHKGLSTGATGPAPVASCSGEEYLERATETENTTRPRMCLRFSMGFANAGDGAFRLRPRPTPDALADAGARVGTHDLPLAQVVCTVWGASCNALPAASTLVARYHASHRHLHYQNAYTFQLFEVESTDWAKHGKEPPLSELGPGFKRGLNPSNMVLDGWDRFHQRDAFFDGAALEDREIALQAGWGDVYVWNLDGNYVEFPLTPALAPAPGVYLLRMFVDANEEIVETNEHNNDGYTLFEVSANGAIKVRERGYGKGPWDPKATIAASVP